MLGLVSWCDKNSRSFQILIFVSQVVTEAVDPAANAKATKTAQSRKIKNYFKIKMARLPSSQSGITSKSAVIPSIKSKFLQHSI